MLMWAAASAVAAQSAVDTVAHGVLRLGMAMEFGGADGIPAVLLLAGAVAGALLAIGAALRGAWRGVRTARRGIRRVVGLVEDIEHRSRELTNNGGGSIKDRSDQSVGRLTAVETKLNRMEGEMTALCRRVDLHLARGGE